MAFLDQHPVLGYPAAAGLGLLIGSFLNVVILRLPRRMEWSWKRDSREILGEPELYDPPPPGIVVERSHCPHCGHQLAWYENIPVLSWLVLRGKCRSCKAPISIQHILPNLMSLLVVQAAIQFAVGIVAEAGLSYVGLGAQPPAPSWGRMLAEAQTMIGFAPWLAIMPGLAIFVTVLGLSLTGDGLRDLFDPRVRRER